MELLNEMRPAENVQFPVFIQFIGMQIVTL